MARPEVFVQPCVMPVVFNIKKKKLENIEEGKPEKDLASKFKRSCTDPPMDVELRKEELMSSWKQDVKERLPDLHQKTVLLPHVHFTRVDYQRLMVSGREVKMIQPCRQMSDARASESYRRVHNAFQEHFCESSDDEPMVVLFQLPFDDYLNYSPKTSKVHHWHKNQRTPMDRSIQREAGKLDKVDNGSNKTHAIHTHGNSLTDMINPVHTHWNNHTDKTHPVHTQRNSHTDMINPVHTQRNSYTDMINPVHTQRNIHTEKIHPVHTLRTTHTEKTHPVHTQRNSYTDMIHPVHTHGNSHTDMTHPVHILRGSHTVKIHPVHIHGNSQTDKAHPFHTHRNSHTDKTHPFHTKRNSHTDKTCPIYIQIPDFTSWDQFDNGLPTHFAKGFETTNRPSLLYSHKDLSLFPRPRDINQRGEFDILMLHRNYGIILIEIKSVGDAFNQWSPNECSIFKDNVITNILYKCIRQLHRAEQVLRHTLHDLDADNISISKGVALPNLEKTTVKDRLEHDQLLRESFCHCLGVESLTDALQQCIFSHQLPLIGQTSDLCYDAIKELREGWWLPLVEKLHLKNISKDCYESIVARFCGPATLRLVPTAQSGLAEVTTLGQAVMETYRCYTAPVLTEEQVETLQDNSPRVYISGLPGSNKTLLLILKARQWLIERNTVIVLSLWHGSEAVSHLIYRKIQENLEAGTESLHHLLCKGSDFLTVITQIQVLYRQENRPSTAENESDMDSEESLSVQRFRNRKKRHQNVSSQKGIVKVARKPSGKAVRGSVGLSGFALQSSVENVLLYSTSSMEDIQISPTSSLEHLQVSPKSSLEHLQISPTSSMDHSLISPTSCMEHIRFFPPSNKEHIQSSLTSSMENIQFSPASSTEHGQFLTSSGTMHSQSLARPLSGKTNLDWKSSRLRTYENTDPHRKIYIVMDETSYLLDLFTKKLEDALGKEKVVVWAASCLPNPKPRSFKSVVLTQNLRCPPVVVNKIMSSPAYSMFARSRYKPLDTRVPSSMPLPTDGPSVKVIHHHSLKHNSGQPADCEQCGKEVAHFLRHNLQIGKNPSSTRGLQEESLCFGDVLISGHVSALDTACCRICHKHTMAYDWKGYGSDFAASPQTPGFLVGLCKGKVKYEFVRKGDRTKIASLAKPVQSECVQIADPELVLGLERPVVVALGASDIGETNPSYVDPFMCTLSRCSSQLIIVGDAELTVADSMNHEGCE